MISAPPIPVACREARAHLDARTPPDDRHVEGCAGCTAYHARVVEMAGALDQVARGLDDLARARVEANVLAALASSAAPTERLVRRWPGWAIAPLAAAAALAAVYWAVPPPAAAPLVPRLVAGFVPPSELTRAMLGGRVEQVRAPAGGRVQVQIDDVAVVELQGLGALSSAPTRGRDVELVLSSGRVLVDVDHGAERTFRVRAGAVTVEVVGTRFLVDYAPPDRVQVAVARGHVRVYVGADVVELDTGAAWDSGAGVEAIDREAVQVLSALRVERLSQPGVLQLEAPTGVEVRSFDGAVLGRSPLWVALPAGRVALELRRDDRVLATPTAEIHEGAATHLEVVVEAPASASAHSGAGDAGGAPPSEHAPPSDRGATDDPATSRARTRAPIAETSPEPPHAGAAARLDAEAIYRVAEEAMAAHDDVRAAIQLDALVERFPADALVASALYERARLAVASGDRALARARLARLRSLRDADLAIAEPAHVLACQLEIEDGRAAEARACLLDLRARYPRSVHDRATLVDLARLDEASGGCQAARPWLELLVGLYPQDPAGRDASARLVRCPR